MDLNGRRSIATWDQGFVSLRRGVKERQTQTMIDGDASSKTDEQRRLLFLGYISGALVFVSILHDNRRRSNNQKHKKYNQISSSVQFSSVLLCYFVATTNAPLAALKTIDRPIHSTHLLNWWWPEMSRECKELDQWIRLVGYFGCELLNQNCAKQLLVELLVDRLL